MSELYNPLVSIITPFYNVEAYLAETIKSVIHQEYVNWELILIDDGSSDASTTIAKSYADKFPGKIFYLEHSNHSNRGAAASRNEGISMAKGELISFLDSDDYLLPNKLKEQVALFKQMPEASVICESTKYWYSWSDVKNNDVILPIGAEQDRLYQPPELACSLYPLGAGASFCTCALIFKREVIRRIGGFDETFVGKNQLYEDQVFFIKLCLHEKIYISSLCNNLYRQRPDSLMHGLNSEGYEPKGRYFFLIWMQAYLQQNNIRDKNIRRLMKKALLPYNHPILYKLTGKIKSALRKLKKKNSFYYSLINSPIHIVFYLL